MKKKKRPNVYEDSLGVTRPKVYCIAGSSLLYQKILEAESKEPVNSWLHKLIKKVKDKYYGSTQGRKAA
jgi:hypothetical protein